MHRVDIRLPILLCLRNFAEIGLATVVIAVVSSSATAQFSPNQPAVTGSQVVAPIPVPAIITGRGKHHSQKPVSNIGIASHVPADSNLGGSLAPVGTPQPNVPAYRLAEDRPWTWQLFPNGLLYRNYLAGEKESRFGTAWLYEKDRGWIWDITLGGRVGIIRNGTVGDNGAEGWQLDIEGAAFPRLDPNNEDDLESVDFRFGVPLTWSRGPWELKTGYYHISSHVGDEFLERNPGFVRVNYVRDSILLGVAYHLSPALRAYSEVGWAFSFDGGAKPWQFQFGFDYSPPVTRGHRGKPFAAVNAHLREEQNFSGNVNVMTGWQWRGRQSGRLLRMGLQYYNGKSSQYAFFRLHEELLGFGLWVDY